MADLQFRDRLGTCCCCGELLSCLGDETQDGGIKPCSLQQQRQRSPPSVPGIRDKEETPSAPSLSLMLFNSEEHSDVAFFVGPQGSQWRFPAHSFVVCPTSPVLEALVSRCRSVLEDALDPQREFCGIVEDMKKTANDVCLISIKGTKPDIFERMLRYIYTRKVNFRCVNNCLSILETSMKFQVCALSSTCLEYLLDHVTERNALEVLCGVRRSAESLDIRHVDDEDDNLKNELITKCFSLIDNNADTVLTSEAFENIEQALLLEIASRDSLRASSESRVFGALMRWSCQECKRRRLELLADNRRKVLGPALYSVRFLLMSQDEFQLGPVTSGMLTEQEQQSILTRLNGNTKAVLPVHLQCRGRDLPMDTLHNRNLCTNATSSRSQTCQSQALAKKQKRSRLLNGLGDIMIGVFTLLD